MNKNINFTVIVMQFICYILAYIIFTLTVEIIVYRIFPDKEIEQFDLKANKEKIENYKKNNNYIKLLYTFFIPIIYVPVFEEVLFRGYLYKFLQLYLPKFSSIILSSLIFAILHFHSSNKGNFIIMLFCFLHGLFWAISYHTSNCILYPIALHSIANLLAYLP